MSLNVSNQSFLYKIRITPLLSSWAQKKNLPSKWMVPPNSLGQMLNFGTSFEKFYPELSEKIAVKVILWICIITPWKITKNLHFANFHPLDQARPQFDINKTWSLWKNLSFAIKKSKIGKPYWSQSTSEDWRPRRKICAFTK